MAVINSLCLLRSIYWCSVLPTFGLWDPHSSVKDSKKNVRDVRKRGYIGESVCRDWFTGKLSEPIREEHGKKRRDGRNTGVRLKK